MKINAFLLIVSICIFYSSCNKNTYNAVLKSTIQDSKLLEVHTLSDAYLVELADWKENRYKSITSPEGWLSLIGLYWLKEGENRIGSGESNDIVLPHFMGDYIASLHLENGSLKFKPYGESFLNNDGDQPETDGTIYHDGQSNTTKLHASSLIMYVLKREDRYGLRIKNTLAEARYELESIPNFAPNAAFIKTAKVVPVEAPKEMFVQSVIGTNIEYNVSGYIHFIHEGKAYKLTAFDGGSEYYFVLFKDETASKSTYGGGRFIDVKRPEDGESYVKLDFNKAYNPPCVFTNYATCPLPPQENYLPFEIHAGEKSIKNHK